MEAQEARLRKKKLEEEELSRRKKEAEQTYIGNLDLEELTFKEGLAFVKYNEKRGFIDKTRNLVIPFKYTNIIRHRNPETFEVWKDGKVGYYNGSYNVVFEPAFDDFKVVHLDYTYGCALKYEGKWELYDSFEPEKLVEGNAKSIEELIGRWLDR